jgi:hypothetical protein
MGFSLLHLLSLILGLIRLVVTRGTLQYIPNKPIGIKFNYWVSNKYIELNVGFNYFPIFESPAEFKRLMKYGRSDSCDYKVCNPLKE